MLNETNNDFDGKILNLDLADYWLVIQKRFVGILLVFALVLVISIYLTVSQEKVYEAASKIKIAARQPMATIEGAQIVWYGGGGAASIQSEIELISNKDAISDTVYEILEERTRSKRFEENSKYFTEDEVTYMEKLRFSSEEEIHISGLNGSAIKAKLKIDPIVSSDIVLIRASDKHEAVAEALANLFAMVYKADFWKSKTLDAEETKIFIEEQLNNIKLELENNKKELEKTSEENVFLGNPEVYKDELSKLKIEQKRLSEVYQPAHPRMEKQKKLIASVESELAKVPRSKQGYDDRLAEWELKQDLRKTLGEYYLKAEIDYKAKKEKTKDEIQIISRAAPGSAVKIKPQEAVTIAAGCILGIIIAFVYAFVWEGLDTSIGKIEDVEKITKLPVIAHIPMIGGDGRERSFLGPLKILYRYTSSLFGGKDDAEPINIYQKTLFNFGQLSIESESYRTLRNNLQFAMGTHKDNGNVISITSTSPREGKTLTSTNLAIAMAQLGKSTLLLEGDMRRPKISEIFKLHDMKGLSDVLIGTVSAESAICTSADLLMSGIDWDKFVGTSGIDNLHVLPAGTIPPNPSELLLSNDFRQLIESVRTKYDFVIIDTPPTLPVSDAGIIGTVSDGTVLIYQSDKTSRHLLLRAIKMLLKNKVKIFGIVINQLEYDVVIKSSRYGYEYYSKSSASEGGKTRAL
jgi:capsular exopolysaccharide synthesis family protein